MFSLDAPPSFLNILNASDLTAYTIQYLISGLSADPTPDIKSYNFAYTVTMQYYTSQTLAGSFDFTIGCSGAIFDFVEDAYNVAATEFDLLADTSAQIALPTVQYSPMGCQALTWKVYRVSDGADMEADMPSVFQIGATHLTIMHNIDSFGERLGLYGHDDYFFKGSINDVGYKQTNEFAFVIKFKDACRSASIFPQTIEYPVSTVDESSFVAYPAFEDSVDQAGTYTAGVCGPKRLTLSNGTPGFITVENAQSSFNLVYNNALADENDAGQRTIDYTVSFFNYAGVTQALAGSFVFEIENTCTRTALVEHGKVNESYSIRVDETKIISFRYSAYTDVISDLIGE